MIELIELIIMILLFVSLAVLSIKELLNRYCTLSGYIINGLLLTIDIASVITLMMLIYLIYMKGCV